MDNKNGSETLLLVRKRASLEPVVQSGLAAVELRDTMSRRERFRNRERQGSASWNVARLPRRRTLYQFDHLRHNRGRRG
jgi:hypothetical protein